MAAQTSKTIWRTTNERDTGQVRKASLPRRSSGGLTDHPVTLRLPEKLLDGVDELVPYVADDMEFAAMGRVSRSQVLRIAVLQGLHALRERYEIHAGDSD